MKELKGALILAGGIVIGYYGGLLHGSLIQKSREVTPPAKLSVVSDEKA
jgi:hypothetical protein